MKTYAVEVRRMPAMAGSCSIDGCKGWGNISVSYNPPNQISGSAYANACVMDHVMPAAIQMLRRILRPNQKSFAVSLYKVRVETYQDTVATSGEIPAHGLVVKEDGGTTFVPSCTCGWRGTHALYTNAWQQHRDHVRETEPVLPAIQMEAV